MPGVKERMPSAVALGMFDGMHIGHRQVIAQAVALARENGIPVAEEPFSMVELMNADEVIVTSSSALCIPVESVDGIPVGGRDPERLALLQRAYLEKFHRETAG